MPSKRVLLPLGGIVAVLAFVGVATAQGSPSRVEISLGPRIGIRFVGALLFGALLGGGLLVVWPRYAGETVTALREDPIGAFGWGLLAGIAIPIVLAVVAITIIGLLVAIPGFIALFVATVVGNAVAVLWIGSHFDGTGADPDGKTVLVGAAAIAVPAAIPILGDLVVSVIGLFGLGVVSRRLYESWRGDSRGRSQARGY